LCADGCDGASFDLSGCAGVRWRRVNGNNISEALPTFMTLIATPLTFSIALD